MKQEYDFDTLIDRGSFGGAAKWNMMEAKKADHAAGIVPLSVADMEFQIAPEIRQALKHYIDTQIPGYSAAPKGYAESVCGFMKRRHGLDVLPEYLMQTPGIVYALPRAVRALTEAGDGVIIMTPVYYPFYRVIRHAERKVTECPLIYENGKYAIDFDLFEKLASDKSNTALLMCSPHNPVGRVWTEEEIRRVAEICEKYDLGVIADEIHFDLVFPEHEHFSFGKLEGELANHMILCTAPSKTFNLAGMNLSNLIIRNPALRKKMTELFWQDGMPSQNPFGYAACQAAYEEAEGWLEALLSYLDGNRRFVKEYIEANIPQLYAVPLEGTYLQWIDCTKLGLSKEALEQLMIDHDLFLDEGYLFGDGGVGFERLNLACPRKILAAAMERFKAAVDSL